MNIGVLFCGYNMLDLAQQSVPVWCDKGFATAGVSVVFDKFPFCTDDGTQDYLRGNLDYLADSPDFISEHDARNLALKYLIEEADADLIWMVDVDEMYTEAQIDSILKFIENDPYTDWFSVSFRNFVFDRKTYIEEPFCPPRIFRAKTFDGKMLYKFYWDNEVYYSANGTIIDCKTLSNRTIPTTVAHIDHVTWLNDERSRAKVAYQEARGWKCGYCWGKNGLEFNAEVQNPRVIRLN